MVFDDFNSFFFCHESSIDTHIDTNQLILLSQARTQKTKKSVADGHLTSSKEVEKMGHVMDICETDSVKKLHVDQNVFWFVQKRKMFCWKETSWKI